MDWSDETLRDDGNACPYHPNAMYCDEHICRPKLYSCGDGECVLWEARMAFHRFVPPVDDCSNKRNLNYMCEVSLRPPAWTLDSGLCWTDTNYDDSRYPPWNEINFSELTEEQICQYLVRCFFSNGFERDCPCNLQNCSSMIRQVCTGDLTLVPYPPQGLINANMFFFYNSTNPTGDRTVNIFELGGRLRCRGFYCKKSQVVTLPIAHFVRLPYLNSLLCESQLCPLDHQDVESRFQYSKFCWNDSLTFNGRPYAVYPNVCKRGGICMSQYRIRDGFPDCLESEDEIEHFNYNYCVGHVARHRFQCFDNEFRCLTLNRLGTGTKQCSNNYDEVWYGSGLSLTANAKCFLGDRSDCTRWKDYIGQSAFNNLTQSILEANVDETTSTQQMPFRSYCNSVWNLDDQVDEALSVCRDWICQNQQYRCRTGQCIQLQWVCDGEWDCADASDEEAVELARNWSPHNDHLIGLEFRLEQCRKRYSNSPFSNICNVSFEFGCYRSDVSNPLDIGLNRPCINLTQIGDGIQHCYNAYDEKNTLKSNSGIRGMWGFQFRCGTEFQQYPYACSTKATNCSQILCPNRRQPNGLCSGERDVFCLEENRCIRNARCNGKRECLHGDDEYWCAFGSYKNQIFYRSDKTANFHMYSNFTFSSRYPLPAQLTPEQSFRDLPFNSEEKSSLEYSYVCNRGVTILNLNETRCVCPPAYYGHRCQFFTDRISIIVKLDQNTSLNTMDNETLKIKANLLFDNLTIDSHEFDVSPRIERVKRVKHKFYLLYSRSAYMLEHKRRRYFNRTDIINNHPYSIHFDVFALKGSRNIEELGSWRYPIYFDYLPAFRLAIVLRFPSWFGTGTLDPCRQSRCNSNSSCKPILNRNRSHYCSCNKGYYGKECSLFESRCESYCSPDALCQTEYDHIQLDNTRLDCICPLGHFGRRCYLKHDDCNSNPCLNDGTCFPTYSPSGEQAFICTCSNRFYGKHCEREKASVRVRLNMTTTSSIQATVVQLYNIATPSLTLLIQHEKVYPGMTLKLSYLHSDHNAPYLGLLKTYDNNEQLQYFIMYAMLRPVIDIDSVPQYCPHASLLLFKSKLLSIETIFTCSTFFFADANPSVSVLAQYHRFCRNGSRLICFHDDIYFCLCEKEDQRAECFIRNARDGRCTNCLSGGKCFQGDHKDFNEFICICPPCHKGYLCEFNMEPFGFTLNSLLADFPTKVKLTYLILASLFFSIGLFNNYCSLITFKRASPRTFGTGSYLLIVTCLNQLGLLCLLWKFIEISFRPYDRISCKTISFLLSVFTRSTYWLNSWISVNRCLVILVPNSPALKNSRLAIGISVFTVLVLLCMHVHELIHYTIIRHLSSGLSLCVTNFGTRSVSTYNQISTLVHYMAPFFIQTVSITLLIVFAARSRARVSGEQMAFYQVLKKQFQAQKELYVTSALIVLSALPQLILTFSLACTELIDWQRHVLLGAYLLSYAPQVLGFIFYVLPSTSYKKEFGATSFAKRFFKRMFENKITEQLISKATERQNFDMSRRI
jgi:Low-density lipoprotein receptor domain class A/EGF-like domain